LHGLELHEDGFCAGDAAGTSEAVGEGDLRGFWLEVARGVFGDDFIGVGGGGRGGEGFDGFDAGDTGGDEVVEVGGAEDSAHFGKSGGANSWCKSVNAIRMVESRY